MFKEVLPLSSILAFRFFGLFVVMPVLSLYALMLDGANAMLIGVAVGGYALSQFALQIPFGLLSDKIGRKVTIAMGLLIFILGSIVCYLADDIYMLILGRFLQGAGAIGAVVSAMIADVVKEESRTKAMAIMGGSISVSFTLAMILGPVLSSLYGTEYLFLLSAVLALLSIVVLYMFGKTPPKVSYSFKSEESRWYEVLKDKNLQRMNLTNFLQKGFMTLTFIIIPIASIKAYGFEAQSLYQIYIPAAILGLFAMAPAAIIAQKRSKYKEVLIFGILLFALSYILLGVDNSLFFFLGVMLFFIGFSTHEPIMQSLASKFAKAHQKGAALGVFNSFGYLGTFAGGVLGGFLYEVYGIGTITIFVVTSSIFWATIIYFMPNPSKLKNCYFDIEHITYKKEVLENLNELDGIVEWYINEHEKIAIIKYDSDINSEDDILKFLRRY